jgi:uncharacterized protein YggE
MRRGVPITCALLAVSLFWALPAGAAERTVTVRGSATQKVPNDAAKLGFSVSVERRSRAAALHAVAARLRAVIATVQASPGVGPGDATTGAISVRKIRRDERTLFRASEGVGVILHEPARAGDLVNAAVTAGATGTRGPFFFASNPEAALQQHPPRRLRPGQSKGPGPGHPRRRSSRPRDHDRGINGSGPGSTSEQGT